MDEIKKIKLENNTLPNKLRIYIKQDEASQRILHMAEGMSYLKFS